jgi:3-dehydroquinate synthetase
MGSDKKKMAEKLHFILPVKIGEVVDCINPDVKLLMEVISELRS